MAMRLMSTIPASQALLGLWDYSDDHGGCSRRRRCNVCFSISQVPKWSRCEHTFTSALLATISESRISRTAESNSSTPTTPRPHTLTVTVPSPLLALVMSRIQYDPTPVHPAHDDVYYPEDDRAQAKEEDKVEDKEVV